jgi:hypothetical protein
MPERYLLRTEGGPFAGETRVAGDPDSPSMTWPLPPVLEYDRTGQYVKVRESDLPPMPDGSGVLRGATYEWRPAGDGTVYVVTAVCLHCSIVGEYFWSGDGDIVCRTCRQPERYVIQRTATADEVAGLGEPADA